jgi:hypothetical protein
MIGSCLESPHQQASALHPPSRCPAIAPYPGQQRRPEPTICYRRGRGLMADIVGAQRIMTSSGSVWSGPSAARAAAFRLASGWDGCLPPGRWSVVVVTVRGIGRRVTGIVVLVHRPHCTRCRPDGRQVKRMFTPKCVHSERCSLRWQVKRMFTPNDVHSEQYIWAVVRMQL